MTSLKRVQFIRAAFRVPGAGFHIFLPAPVAIESDSVLCLLTSFMLYFGQPFYVLANNTDLDLFSNSPFSNGPSIAKNKNGCKVRFIFTNIFYLNTSLDAPWRNPGCHWVVQGCILYVGRCWCCNIPSCFPTTVAVPKGSNVGSREWFPKDVQP